LIGEKFSFPGDEGEDGFHGLEAGVTARLSFCDLEQPIEGFDEAAGLARPRPGDDAVEMVADHGGDLLHGLDLGAHDIGAPLREHGGDDIDLLAIEDIAQLFAIALVTRADDCSGSKAAEPARRGRGRCSPETGRHGGRPWRLQRATSGLMHCSNWHD
jgi:hypothetical protein